MPVLMLRLPDLKMTLDGRPRHCPYCGGQILQRWGRVSKTVQDTKSQETEVHRYRCNECERTFRAYPEGIDRANQSLRIRHLAALAWAMGLSCRDVVGIFDEMGVRLSRMSVWRDGQELAALMGNQEHGTQRFSIEKVISEQTTRIPGVIIVIDSGQGEPVVLGKLDEHNPRVVKRWLEPLVREIEIEVSLLETGYLHQLDAWEMSSLPAAAN